MRGQSRAAAGEVSSENLTGPTAVGVSCSPLDGSLGEAFARAEVTLPERSVFARARSPRRRSARLARSSFWAVTFWVTARVRTKASSNTRTAPRP